MKRLFIVVAAIAAFSVSSFANNAVFAKLTDKATFKNVNRYLDTTSEQESYLKVIFEETSKKSEVNAEKAMLFNIANAKAVLTPEQYKKYIIVLNMTVNNESYNELIAEK